MHQAPEAHVADAPAFDDAALSATERRDGALASWRQALQQQGAVGAARAARGHFAIGLRDQDGAAFLAVDRFATQTLCYSIGADGLRFSPRADDLATSRDDIDLQSIYDYLYFHAIPAPRTVFRGVQRLPAGHCLTFANGQATLQRYWQPSFDERPAGFATSRQRFRDLLAQAVRRQLDGTRAACFLSGGTDSSTVAGMIGEVSGKPAATYSIGFEAEGYDEMAFARIAARHFGTEHHEYYVTPADLVRSIPAMAKHHDQPFGNSSALPAFYCALKAREDGVTRLLAGDGGDELFGGNSRYATQRVFAWYQALPAALRKHALEALTDRGTLDALPLLRKVASYVRQARVPMPDRLQTYNLLGRMGREQVLTPAFLAQVNAQGPAQQERDVWSESGGASLVNRMLAFDWRYTLAENDLPKVRGAAELAGVTVGYPLLDQDLVEFSEQLSSDDKLRRLKLRWFFKEALRGFLPDEIITKKKQGFGLPFGVWATRDAALKALAVDSVRGLGERGIVRREFTSDLVDHYLPEHPGYYGSMVWILMMLEQWFRAHAPDYKLAG
ncbi:MAG: asparagine synthase C-terminal domain-containing protein [Rubrivivax sp.]